MQNIVSNEIKYKQNHSNYIYIYCLFLYEFLSDNVQQPAKTKMYSSQPQNNEMHKLYIYIYIYIYI